MCSYLPAPQLLKQKFHIFPCNEISIYGMIPKLTDLLTKSLKSKKQNPKPENVNRGQWKTSEGKKEKKVLKI